MTSPHCMGCVFTLSAWNACLGKYLNSWNVCVFVPVHECESEHMYGIYVNLRQFFETSFRPNLQTT